MRMRNHRASLIDQTLRIQRQRCRAWRFVVPAEQYKYTVSKQVALKGVVDREETGKTYFLNTIIIIRVTYEWEFSTSAPNTQHHAQADEGDNA